MINEFIAVITVFIVVNGLVLLVLFKISNYLKIKAKNEFVSKLNVYDTIIDSKINEIKTLEEKIDELNGKNNEVKRIFGKSFSNSFGSYKIRNVANYTDENFYENYRYLKNAFKLDYTEIVDDFIKKVLNNDIDNQKLNDNTYKNILFKLNFDLRFTLMSKDENSQIAYLMEIFNDDEIAVLNYFVKNNDDFKLLTFIEFVKNNEILNSSKVEIRVAKDLFYINKQNGDDRINFVIDEDILEGLKIIYKNKVYDYSFGR